MQWTGSLAASMETTEDYEYARAYAIYGIDVRQDGVGTLATYQRVHEVFAGWSGWGYGPTAAKAVNDVRTFVLPIGSGAPLRFIFSLTAAAEAQHRAAPWDQVYIGGSASSDFYNTAKIIGLEFRDSNNAPVADFTDYAFVGGAQVFPSTVPEPRTWALLGTGLLGLGVVARRRRAA
jgi:hypothetical protein